MNALIATIVGWFERQGWKPPLIQRDTWQLFGPARSVMAEMVFEIGFKAIHPSKRHTSDIATNFPRILRWRHDRPSEEAA